jgi:ABC-2 type transport system ATP-binding protein
VSESSSQDPAGRSLAISATGLTKRFDDEAVVRGLDLAIDHGTIVGLIGPSGCGKTTTVRMLAGLLSPSEGTAALDGRPAGTLTSAERERIGYLPQTPALFPDLSVWENLSFHASMYGLPFRRRQLLMSLLEWVELSGDRRKRVRQVSGGMQRRLALAAAFVHDPDIVFLDEPTAGIDPILRDKFWRQFRVLAADGRTLVVTTQYVGEAAHCDLVGLLSDGELLMLDTPDNLRRAAFGGEVLDVVFAQPATDDDVARLSALPFVIGAAERDGVDRLRIVVDDADEALMQITSQVQQIGLELVEAQEHTVDYDEAFVRVVERHRQTGSHAIDSAGPVEPVEMPGPEPVGTTEGAFDVADR